MPWDREANEEYDDGYTRESFERADEDDGSEDDYEDARQEGYELGRSGAGNAVNPYNRVGERMKYHGWEAGYVEGVCDAP